MRSTVVKHSIAVNGRKTSISVEQPFWEGLKEIAQTDGLTLSSAIAAIDRDSKHGNLSWAIRVFLLNRFSAGHVGHHEPLRSDSQRAAVLRPQSTS
jgi:predicted DNA-binding ribbon-helix-helix protein